MWDDIRFAIDPTIVAVSNVTIIVTVRLLAGPYCARKCDQLR